MLFIVSLNFVQCSTESGVNSIVCVFEEFRIRFFCLAMFVCVTLSRSLCKCTVSNAFDMSSVIAIVLSGVCSC